MAARLKDAPEGSYTRRLFSDSGLLASKLREEADELAVTSNAADAAFEAADVIYFAMVKALREGASLADIERELERRSYKVQRRPGNAKPGYDASDGGSAWTGHSLRRIGPEEIPSPQARLFDAQVDGTAAQAIEDVRRDGEAGAAPLGREAWRAWSGESPSLSTGRVSRRRNAASTPRRSGCFRARANPHSGLRGRPSAPPSQTLDIPVPGGRAGHDFVPVARAGCYVPGGRYPLPSTALMTVTPAVAAGVPEVWCAGPKPTDVTLGRCGYCWSRGLPALRRRPTRSPPSRSGWSVPRCDVVVGPGGRYVASAKRQLFFGAVGTEAPAGPSELLVLADGTANPDIVAADLIAQAEHDTAAVPMLICASEAFAQAVETALAARLAAMPEPNRSTAAAALANGWALVAANETVACSCAERCAPEHLELSVADPSAAPRKFDRLARSSWARARPKYSGTTGPVLTTPCPPAGAARFASGLSVLNFLRARTWLQMDDPSALRRIRPPSRGSSDWRATPAPPRPAAGNRAGSRAGRRQPRRIHVGAAPPARPPLCPAAPLKKTAKR